MRITLWRSRHASSSVFWFTNIFYLTVFLMLYSNQLTNNFYGALGSPCSSGKLPTDRRFFGFFPPHEGYGASEGLPLAPVTTQWASFSTKLSRVSEGGTEWSAMKARQLQEATQPAVNGNLPPAAGKEVGFLSTAPGLLKDSSNDEENSDPEGAKIEAYLTFFLCSLLSAALLQWLISHITVYTIPISVIWFLFGMMLELALGQLKDLKPDSSRFDEGVFYVSRIHAKVVYHILLPILLFEACINVNWHKFKRFAYGGISLAVLGVAYQVAVVGFLTQVSFQLGKRHDAAGNSDDRWSNAFLLASVLASTDPVAVISVLNGLNAPGKLAIMFEGESLINDGSSMLLFQFFKSLSGGHVEIWEGIVKSLLLLLVVAPIWGMFVASVMHIWVKRFRRFPEMQALALITAGYTLYFVGEVYLQTSGPMAIVSYGLYYTAFGHIGLGSEGQKRLYHSVQAIASLANTCIFIIAGVVAMRMMLETIMEDNGVPPSIVSSIPILYVYLLIARASMIIFFLPILKRTGYGINWKEVVLLVWGGLRGAIVLAMGLMIEQDTQIWPKMRYQAVLYIAGTTLLLLLVNGISFELVYKLLNPYPPKPFRRVYLERVMKLIDYQYMEERQALEQHWLFRGTSILEHANKAVPVLGWRRMDKRGRLDFKLPNIEKALASLPLCDQWSFSEGDDQIPYNPKESLSHKASSPTARYRDLSHSYDAVLLPPAVSPSRDTESGIPVHMRETENHDHNNAWSSAISATLQNPCTHVSEPGRFSGEEYLSLFPRSFDSRHHPGSHPLRETRVNSFGLRDPGRTGESFDAKYYMRLLEHVTEPVIAEGESDDTSAKGDACVAPTRDFASPERPTDWKERPNAPAVGEKDNRFGSRVIWQNVPRETHQQDSADVDDVRRYDTDKTIVVPPLDLNDENAAEYYMKTRRLLHYPALSSQPRLKKRGYYTRKASFIPGKESLRGFSRYTRSFFAQRKSTDAGFSFKMPDSSPSPQPTLPRAAPRQTPALYPFTKGEKENAPPVSVIRETLTRKLSPDSPSAAITPLHSSLQNAARSLSRRNIGSSVTLENEDLSLDGDHAQGAQRQDTLVTTNVSFKHPRLTQRSSSLSSSPTFRSSRKPCPPIIDGLRLSVKDTNPSPLPLTVCLPPTRSPLNPSPSSEAQQENGEEKVVLVRDEFRHPSSVHWCCADNDTLTGDGDTLTLEPRETDNRRFSLRRHLVRRLRLNRKTAFPRSQPVNPRFFDGRHSARDGLPYRVFSAPSGRLDVQTYAPRYRVSMLDSLSARSSEEFLAIPETPRMRDDLATQKIPKPVALVRVLRTEREGELYIMAFNAMRQMYRELYRQHVIGGSAMLSLGSVLDTSTDFAIGKLRRNPIKAWQEALKAAPTEDEEEVAAVTMKNPSLQDMTGFEFEWRALVSRLHRQRRRSWITSWLSNKFPKHSTFCGSLTYPLVLRDLQQITAFVEVHEELLARGGLPLEALLGPKLLASFKQQVTEAKSYVARLQKRYPEGFPYALAIQAATVLVNLKQQLVEEQARKGLILEEDSAALNFLFEEQHQNIASFRPANNYSFLRFCRRLCQRPKPVEDEPQAAGKTPAPETPADVATPAHHHFLTVCTENTTASASGADAPSSDEVDGLGQVSRDRSLRWCEMLGSSSPRHRSRT